MFIGLTLPVFILGSLALALADYLWRLIKPPVPATVPLSQPYTPPFIGGQCVTRYRVTFDTNSNRPNQNVQNVVLEFNGAILGYSYRSFTSGAYDYIQVVFDAPNAGIFGTVARGIAEDFSPANLTGFISNLQITRVDGLADNCGNLPNPNPTLPIGGNGLPSTPPPVLYPPPNSPPNTPPTTPNNNWFQLIAGAAALVGAAAAAAATAAAAGAGTAITAGAGAAAAAAAASASAPSGSTTQKQADSQKLSADALVGIAQVLAEIVKQIQELEKEIRKLKTKESKKEEDDAKKVIRYDFGSANRDGFIKLYPDSNPDSYEATFIDVQIFNIPSGSGKYFGDKSPHYYKYKSLGQVHFVSPTFGILESREIDFARLSLNVPDNCFGFFYHFGLDGIVSANLSGFYTKTEKQSV